MPSPQDKIGPVGYILAQVVWMVIVFGVVQYINLRYFRGRMLLFVPLWGQAGFWLTMLVITIISGHIHIIEGPREFYKYLYSIEGIVRLLLKLLVIAVILFLLIWGFKINFLS